jgi:anionic cell wall polymer biosynthesis LytR-Cps2A-Psr (LCP) family protein
MTWLNVSLMYHMLFVAVVLMSQYLFVYYTFSMHAKYFKNYEQDLEDRKKSVLVIKLDSKHEKEYEMLMNEMNDDEQEDD